MQPTFRRGRVLAAGLLTFVLVTASLMSGGHRTKPRRAVTGGSNLNVQTVPLAPVQPTGPSVKPPPKFLYGLAYDTAVPARPSVADPTPDWSVSSRSTAEEKEAAPLHSDEKTPFGTAELESIWHRRDPAEAKRSSWDQFLRDWVDPLVVESDGVSFYDPTEYRVRSVLPVKEARGIGFGVKFRVSF